MSGMAQDLQICMAHHMEIKEEDVLEISPLEPTDDESPIPSEEAALLEKSQVAESSGEQAPKPKDAIGLEEITTGSLALQRCPQLPP